MAATWSPFFWVQYGLYRMGIHNLFGICFAVFFVPALAFASDVRVGVSPTTGYYEVTSKTFNVPKGASVSSSTAVSPTVTPLSGGGFQQSMGAGITIEGLKKPAPFTARAAAGLQTMRNGAKKLARSNPARFAAAVGIGALLDSIGAIVDNSGKVVRVTEQPIEPNINFMHWSANTGGIVSDPVSAAEIYNAPSPRKPNGICASGRSCSFSSSDTYFCTSSSCGLYLLYSKVNSSICPSGSIDNGVSCVAQTVDELSSSDLDSEIDSKYEPDASDFVLLTPYMPPDYLLVDPIPPVQTDLGITNTYDSTGALIGSEQKTSMTDFTISNNSSAQPSISSSTSVKIETFKDGQSQGSTVTETDQPAVSGGGAAPQIDIPTDCDFMPTVCAFLDWFKADDTPDDPDLSALIDNRDFTETYSITGGSKQCPADYEFTVDFIGRTYGLSFEPACDFASKMYYFVMAAAYIFAAYITIGASRNG